MEELLKRFTSFLAAKGMRLTDYRLVVVRAALTKRGKFDAESLVEEFGDALSRSTVYRTLHLMKEAGLLSSPGGFNFEATDSPPET